MPSKRFHGKACAYCGVPAISCVGEHVLARRFVPQGRARDYLPKVPACVPCNDAKHNLEEYAHAVVMLGGRHPAAVENVAENLQRLARLKPRVMHALTQTVRQGWEQTPAGLTIPTGVLTVDPIRMRDFQHMIVKGLFCHHAGYPLPPGTVLHSQMTERDRESILVDGTIHAFGPDVLRIRAEIGAGILNYQAIISTVAHGASAWQIEFGQMLWVIGKELPRSAVSRRFVMTMPPTSKSGPADLQI